MMTVACHEMAPTPAPEPASAAPAFRRSSITPVLDTRGTRRQRRRRGTAQSIAVPVHSLIVYRAGTISIR
jgi:hypothetical protein